MGNLKLRAPVPFPAQVAGAGGIKVSKASGLWTIQPDFTQLGQIAASAVANPASKEVWVFDPTTGQYNVLSLSDLGLSVGVTPSTPQGRLTLTPSTPFPSADVVGATSIYYAPTAAGMMVPVFDGFALKMRQFTASATDTVGMTLALDNTAAHANYHQNAHNFDLFAAWVAGVLYFGSGPAWQSDIARGTGVGTSELQLFNGFWTNKNVMTLRYGNAAGSTVSVPVNQATYLGMFRTSADGQTTCTIKPAPAVGGTGNLLLLDNAYNQAVVAACCRDSTASWNYTLAAWIQLDSGTNGGNSNRIQFVKGLPGAAIAATALTTITTSIATGNTAYVGIGYDSVTNYADGCLPGVIGAPSSSVAQSALTTFSQTIGDIGYHYVQALQYSNASGTTTWYGNNGSGLNVQTGLNVFLAM